MTEKELELKQKEIEMLEKTLNAKSDDILKQKEVILSDSQKLENEKRQLEIAKKDIQLQKSNLEQSKKDELEKIRLEVQEQKQALQDEITEMRLKGLQEVAEKIDENRKALLNDLEAKILDDRKSRYEELDKEIALIRKNAQKEIEASMLETEKEKQSIKLQKDAMLAKEAELRAKEAELVIDDKICKISEENNKKREEEISNKISQQIKGEKEYFEKIIAQKDIHIEEMSKDLARINKVENDMQLFITNFGDNPEVLKNKMNKLMAENENIKNELVNRPSVEIKEKLEVTEKLLVEAQNEKEDISELYRELLNENNQNQNFELENRALVSKNAEYESIVTDLESQNERYQDRIKRLSTTEGRVADRDERVKDIKLPIVEFKTDDGKYSAVGKEQPINEIEWLKNIENKCEEYGIVFPKRILYAFHTSLKISDWSPVTVLAGVSGTGKSELPRLYSAFGGINFINVAVQPNWDSQESMLGFFNSIDNKFDAQPLLRYLAQCTDKEDLGEYVSIALLDEMNLAHVEHYFADFLSKFEERRGKTRKNIPHIDVKLGSGIAPFELDIARNILWTGTMNQDETTKSLSDKVLDRGIVINFPRPTELKSRKSMGNIDELKNDTLLKYDTWAGTIKVPGWVKRELQFSDEQIEEMDRFRGIVEEINSYLGVVGRAMGHRVWQSIEYYVANYPTVSAIIGSGEKELTTELRGYMHTAFEDQIVQKIMPKLRGIETRGKSKTECLDKIQKLLEDNNFNLTEDFKNACDFGYGQFMWCSAIYINEDKMIEAEIINEGTENLDN